MRIAINAFFQGQPNTGSGQYVINLVRAMSDLSSHEFVILRPRWPHVRGRRDACSPGNTSVLPARDVWVSVPFEGNLGKLWFEQVGVPLAARRLGADLLHVPYLGSPFLSPCPIVVTVHDLIMKILPEYRGSWAVRSYTSLACASARRSKLVIADSSCTRDDIVRLLGLATERIRVVYLGCDDRYRRRPDDNALAIIRQKYGLADKFILYIGGFDSRKNVGRLIQAFGRMAGDLELAIAGRPHSGNRTVYPALGGALCTSGAADRIKLLGFVPEEDKPALYSAASLFVYPSLYEGFGLPPLEAMACGTPVMCSNASSLPEVVGTAAALVDPKDSDAMVQCMRGILGNDAMATEMGRLGRERARQFNWQHCAVETMAVYGEALGDARR